MDARTRKLAGLAIIAAGIVLAVVGGLADQVGIGANDESEIGGKQIAALVVGLLLIAGGAALATVLAKDTGEAGATAAPRDATDATDAAEATPTPAAGTPVTDIAEPADTDDTADDTDEPSDTAEPVEVTDSSSD